MFRFGMRFEMPEAFDRLQYYGRGPGENYADRKSSAFVGLYRQSVDEQFHPLHPPAGDRHEERPALVAPRGHRRTGSYGDLRRSVLPPRRFTTRRSRSTKAPQNGRDTRPRSKSRRTFRYASTRCSTDWRASTRGARRCPNTGFPTPTHVPPEDRACDPPISRATRPKAGVPRGFRPFYRPQDLPGRQKMRIFVVR